MAYVRNNVHLDSMKKHHEEQDALKLAIGKKLINEREKQIGNKMSKVTREIIIQGGRDYQKKIINYRKFAETKMNCLYGYIVVSYNHNRETTMTYPFFFENFEKAFDYTMTETGKFFTENERQDVQVDFKEEEDGLLGAVITDFRYTPYRYSIITSCTTYTITRVLFAPNFSETFLIPNNTLDNIENNKRELKIHEF